MKKILLILALATLVFTCLRSQAFELRYLAHTHMKDVNSKKKKALGWYTDNVDYNKFYFLNSDKHISYLKGRALRWYGHNVDDHKFYFLNAEKEIVTQKKKALKWYDRNSW